MHKCTTENAIEELVVAIYGPAAGLRHRHILTQSLHALVRLAKEEQLAEMRRDTERASGTMVNMMRARQAKAVLRRIGMAERQRQCELEFDQQHSAVPANATPAPAAPKAKDKTR